MNDGGDIGQQARWQCVTLVGPAAWRLSSCLPDYSVIRRHEWCIQLDFACLRRRGAVTSRKRRFYFLRFLFVSLLFLLVGLLQGLDSVPSYLLQRLLLPSSGRTCRAVAPLPAGEYDGDDGVAKFVQTKRLLVYIW